MLALFVEAITQLAQPQAPPVRNSRWKPSLESILEDGGIVSWQPVRFLECPKKPDNTKHSFWYSPSQQAILRI
jgi:hypothetical protein